MPTLSVANRIFDDVNCLTFIDHNSDELRQNYFLTQLFGSTPWGEIVNVYKILKSGRESSEQRKIREAAATVAPTMSGVPYVWFEYNGFGDYFHSFPVVFSADGLRVIAGVNVEVCSSIRNRIKKAYGEFYVNISKQAALASFLLNSYTNKLVDKLDDFRGSIYYIHRLVDYDGNVENLIFAPSEVRFSEGRELVRKYKEATQFNPNLPQCLECKVRCEFRVANVWM